MRTLSDRERKLVAIGILVALIALVQLLVIGPILGGFWSRAEQREALRQEYARNERIIASIPRLTRRLETRRPDFARFTIAAPDQRRAAPLLQERLRNAVETSGGEFRSVDVLPAPPGSARIRVNARLTLAQLTQVLANAYNGEPFLTVDALSVAADEALVNGRLNPMDVKLEASVPFAPARA